MKKFKLDNLVKFRKQPDVAAFEGGDQDSSAFETNSEQDSDFNYTPDERFKT
jgi:hypothetical protein